MAKKWYSSEEVYDILKELGYVEGLLQDPKSGEKRCAECHVITDLTMGPYAPVEKGKEHWSSYKFTAGEMEFIKHGTRELGNRGLIDFLWSVYYSAANKQYWTAVRNKIKEAGGQGRSYYKQSSLIMGFYKPVRALMQNAKGAGYSLSLKYENSTGRATGTIMGADKSTIMNFNYDFFLGKGGKPGLAVGLVSVLDENAAKEFGRRTKGLLDMAGRAFRGGVKKVEPNIATRQVVPRESFLKPLEGAGALRALKMKRRI